MRLGNPIEVNQPALAGESLLVTRREPGKEGREWTGNQPGNC